MSATNAPPFFVRGTYNRNNGTFVCASGPGFSREYRLKRKIGSGSQSSCFLASSPFVKEDVCLKMLHQYKMKSKKCLHTNTYSIIKTEPPIEGKTGDLVWIKDDFTISVCHRSDAGELTELTLREHVELFGVPNNFDTCDKINPSKRCLPTHFQKFLKSRKKKLLEVELANRVADRCEGNVVRVYRVLEDFGSTWPFHHTMILVTKCFTGGDMFEFLTNCCRGGLRETAALSIIRQVSTALSAAHSVGVVHQDLKVENLLLAERGSLDKVALCDFGLAEHCRPIFNQTVGSACSFAPEKFPTSGSSEFDPLLAESWSLGVLLYTLIWGALPFSNEPWTSTQFKRYQMLQYKLDKSTNARLSKFFFSGRKISEKTLNLLERLLAIDPKQRLLISDLPTKCPWLFNQNVGEEDSKPVIAQ